MILFNKPNEFPRVLKAVNKFTSKQREDLDFVRMILNEDHLELIATDGYSVIVRNIPITMEGKTSAIGRKLFISSSLIKSIPARIEGIKINNNTLEELRNPINISYKRIYDRILEMCSTPIEVIGISRRKAIQDEKELKAMEILGLI